MKKEILSFLKDYSTDIEKIDSLFVTTFLLINKLNTPKNTLIKELVILPSNEDYNAVLKFSSLHSSFSLEQLIELFEYVISPEDKIVTGAVYTPKYIREFIVRNALPKNNISKQITICDPACGCAGFLFTVSKRIKEITQARYKDIFRRNIFGIDIQSYSIKRSKILLALLAISNGEDELRFDFNLFEGNAFDFKWQAKINKFIGFDIVIGNPPYVCSRNIDTKTLALLANWEVSKSGHPDLYIPFFQVGLSILKNGGSLGYITVNTFFKSINGRLLREYFSLNCFSFKIIDFKDEQVFKNRNTYTCICFIEKKYSPHIEYAIASSTSLEKNSDIIYTKNEYASFDDIKGWNLVNNLALNTTIQKIEGLETKIFSKFSFSTGIATLKNDVYIFKPFKQDQHYYFLKIGEKEYPIEKSICREIINSNKITTEDEIQNIKKVIIYPYEWNNSENKFNVIKESVLQSNYPYTFLYLLSKKKILSKRDKQKKQYDSWFAFGRNQGLNIKGLKLFLPHITKSPKFVFSNDENLLFCNGEAIISNNELELKVLKKILESEIFWFYIKKTSKPYASGYLSLGKNYLKDFSLPNFSVKEFNWVLKTDNKKEILRFLLKKYNLKKSDII